MEGSAQTELNSTANREVLARAFPQLGNDPNFDILSPQTSVYNCIAWAMEFTDRWVDMERLPGHWWPDGVTRSPSPSALVQAFEAVGFQKTSSNTLEEGFDKVVLYKDAATEQWTHASRIIADAVEHSKFGAAWDGRHSANAISGDIYGFPYCYMKRRKKHGTPTPSPQGHIGVNLELLKRMLKKD